MTAGSDEAGRPSRIRAFAVQLRAAIPSPAIVLFGSVIWGLVMAVSAAGGIWQDNDLFTLSTLTIFALYFYGGALGFGPGLTLANLLARGRSFAPRFLIGTVIMALATHTATAGIYALQYRAFYAYWHASFPSVVWFFQLAFTSAGAIYIFTINSVLYYYWPFSVVAFLGLGLWFARHQRHESH